MKPVHLFLLLTLSSAAWSQDFVSTSASVRNPHNLSVSRKTESKIGILEVKELSHPGYNYGPTIIAGKSYRHVWWCGFGRTAAGLWTDVIYQRSLDLTTRQWSAMTQVLSPSATGWDSRFTCDPSVIKGMFQNPDDGQSYSLALYYTATDRKNGSNNRIGLAFSNDGLNWKKYSKNPIIVPQHFPTTMYGAGQPATYRKNGISSPLFMFYTDDSTGVGTRVWLRTSEDGIHFSTPRLLSNRGATLYANSDFAYDADNDEVYAAIEFPIAPGDRETRGFGLYRMSADLLLSGQGSWKQLTTITSNTTGAHLNHSPGLVRDGYGGLSLPNIEIYFAAGTNDPNTWKLCSAIWDVK